MRRAISLSPYRGAARTVAMGVLLGFFSFAAEAALKGNLAFVGRSGAVWLVGSFCRGFRSASVRAAAVSGFAVAEIALVSYYVSLGIALHHGDAPAVAVTWAICAGLAGPVLGVSGFWACVRTGRPRWLGQLALSAAFVGEGALQQHARVEGAFVGFLAETAIGLAVPFVVAAARRRATVTEHSPVASEVRPVPS